MHHLFQGLAVGHKIMRHIHEGWGERVSLNRCSEVHSSAWTPTKNSRYHRFSKSRWHPSGLSMHFRPSRQRAGADLPEKGAPRAATRVGRRPWRCHLGEYYGHCMEYFALPLGDHVNFTRSRARTPGRPIDLAIAWNIFALPLGDHDNFTRSRTRTPGRPIDMDRLEHFRLATGRP